MTRIRFENLPSTNTPVSAEDLDKLNNVVISSTEPTTGEEVWLQKGKNLFDKNNVNGLWLNMQGNFTTYGKSHIEKYDCKAGDEFTIKATFSDTSSDNIVLMAFFDNSGNLLERTANNTTYIISKEAPANTAYMYAGHYINIPNTIQLEQGSTATSYEAYIDKKIYTKNDNGVYEKFYDENNANNANCSNSIVMQNINFQSVGTSVTSYNLTNLTGNKELYIQKDNSKVLVFVTVGGLYNNNTGYGIAFDVQMDNSVLSASGKQYAGSANWGGNMLTDGTRRVQFTGLFVFNNVSKGTHNFRIMWGSDNNSVTATIGAWGSSQMQIIEI